MKKIRDKTELNLIQDLNQDKSFSAGAQEYSISVEQSNRDSVNENLYEKVDDLPQPPKNDKGQKREKTHVPSLYFKDSTEFKKDINNTYLNKQLDEMCQMNQMKPIHCTQSDNHYGYTTQQPIGQYFDVANGNNYQSMPQQTTQRQQFETNKFSQDDQFAQYRPCLLYTSPSPRDRG